MAVYDLDAKRKARLEAAGTGPELKLGGKKFRFPPELPFSVVEKLETNPNSDAEFLRELLGEKYETFTKGRSVADMKDAVQILLEHYGVIERNGGGEEENHSSS